MKRISILGSTGSIGSQTLEVIRGFPERFEVVGLCAGKNIDLLAKQVAEFQPKIVSVARKEDSERIKKMAGEKTEVRYGDEGNVAVATDCDCDLVVSSIVGFSGLLPTLAAIRAGKNVAVANKESLVVAGELLISEAASRDVLLLPIDSEHSSVFQTLEEKNREFLKRVIITASGGPFRETSKDDLEKVTVAEALRHPNWEMGEKITIDSATLMNKGFEIIEARWFFDLPLEKISIWVHPQSIVHSIVEYIDGSLITHLSAPDMKIPIAAALSYPKRLPLKNKCRFPDDLPDLTFEKLDTNKFEAPEMAVECLRMGGTYPTSLNAANEAAVNAFLQGKIKFTDIISIVKETLEKHNKLDSRCLDNILEADTQSRSIASAIIEKFQSKL